MEGVPFDFQAWGSQFNSAEVYADADKISQILFKEEKVSVIVTF